ncbi:MAG: L-ribulose-5-phosphate 3-epimerase [Lachnospiraceae bacterium]
MKMYEIGLYEKAMPGELSWREKLLTAKELGYDFVELSVDETDAKLARLDMTGEERLEILKIMNEVGVSFRSMCLSGHRKYPLGSANPATCARGMEIMEKAVQLAADLGIRIIQLAGYDVYYEDSTPETVARFGENLKKATMMAAKAGVMLGFETMETEFMNTVGKAMKYVDLVNSPYLGVYPDSGNLKNAAVTYGTDVYEDIRSGAGHTVAMHLKETVPGKFREIHFGTGHVDFRKTIDTAWEIGVRRFVTEMWYVGQDNWKEDIREAHDMMSAILDQK